MVTETLRPTRTDLFVADFLVTHAINLLRTTAGIKSEVRLVLDELEAQLVASIATRRNAQWSRADAEGFLAEAEIRIDEAFDKLEATMLASQQGLAAAEAAAMTTALRSVLTLQPEAFIEIKDVKRLPPKYLDKLASEVLIEGAPTRDWWKKQAEDARFRFAQHVRQGAAEGETNYQIMRRLTGDPGLQSTGWAARNEQNAYRLVHNSVQTVANQTRLEVFRENGDIVKGVRQISTLDGKTSIICVSYAGAEWDLDGKPIGDNKLAFNGGPPRHWNCRSVLVPITKTFREMGLDIDELENRTRASMDGAVDANLSFGDWLKDKSEEFQDDMLGKGRAKLWRDGKITLSDLLDRTGRPLTVEELRKKYDE